MVNVRRQRPPFPVLYVREYESYLEDMAKEGWRFVGNNQFAESAKSEGKSIRYRLIEGSRDLDDTLLAELQAKGWSYAGPFFKAIFGKDCWHVFSADDPEASDSYFQESLGATLSSLKDNIWTSLIFCFRYTILVIVLLSVYWRTFFFAMLPNRLLPEVIFYGSLFVRDIIVGADVVMATRYVKRVYGQFGTSYTPQDWRKLAGSIKANRIAMAIGLGSLYLLIYIIFKVVGA